MAAYGSCEEIFSFHLARLPLLSLPVFLACPIYKNNIAGLKHSESFFTMNLGRSIASPSRYNFESVALFAWWESEAALNNFLEKPKYQYLNQGWHARIKPYRKWGEVSEIRNAVIHPHLGNPANPVVAVTLAWLKLSETRRFIQWGKPVEQQVRDHPGQKLSLAAMRPFNTFCTFSIWKNEEEMVRMVNDQNHHQAIGERNRRDFHYEFTTLRFKPIKEVGTWNERSGFTL